MSKIREIDDDWLEYAKDYMKIKFNSDDDLPLNKSLKFSLMTITIRCVFKKDSKLYPQVFLDDTLYELQNERINISEGIYLNKTNQSKECMLCHYWYFLHKNFSYGLYLCDGCYNMTQKSIDSKNIV